jgi:hypothetical protein
LPDLAGFENLQGLSAASNDEKPRKKIPGTSEVRGMVALF